MQPARGCELLQARQALREPVTRDMLEVRVDGEAVRHAEGRQVIHALRDRDVAALGDEQRVLQAVGNVSEDDAHLLRCLQEELVAVVAHALRVVDRLAGADAEQDVVRLMVALLQVVHVVGADERQVQLFGERQQATIDDLLPKDVAQPCGGLERRPRLLHPQRAGDFTFQTAA